MFTQLSHNRIGRIELLPLDKGDYPKTSLNLHAANEARAFLGKIRSLHYNASDGPLFLYTYNLQPAVVLRKQDNANGLKLLVMVRGSLTLQVGLTENFLLTEGKLCLFHAVDYWIDLPEASNVQYLLFDTDSLVKRVGLENLAEGCYNLTSSMLLHLSEILQPPKLLAFPEKWLSMQLLNLLHKLSEEIELAAQRSKSSPTHLDFVLAADAFIKRNLDRNFTTLEISKHVCLNECSLKRVFSHHFGMGMHHWQNHLRIELAKQLLEHSDKSILDIAIQCGFNDDNSLRYNFKIATKQPPIDWRKKYKP